MSNINDADDAFLAAKAEIDGVIEEIIADWYRPYAELTLLTFWKKLPQEVRDQLKTMAPDAYKEFAEAIRKIGGNNGTVSR